MAIQQLGLQGTTPVYGAATADLPARQISGRLRTYIDGMSKLTRSGTIIAQLIGKPPKLTPKGAGYGFRLVYQTTQGGHYAQTTGTPILPETTFTDQQFGYVPVKTYLASAPFNGQYLARAKNSAGSDAFMADTVDSVVQDLMNGYQRDMDIKAFQDGSGVLAVVSGAQTTNVVGVRHWFDKDGTKGLRGATYFLEAPANVLFIRPSTGAVVFKSTIANVDEGAAGGTAVGQIELVTTPVAGTIQDGDYIVRGDTSGNDYPLNSLTTAPTKLAIDGFYAPFVQEPVAFAAGVGGNPAWYGQGNYLDVYYTGTPPAGHHLVPQWRPMVFAGDGNPRPWDPSILVNAYAYAKNEDRLPGKEGPGLIVSNNDVWAEHFAYIKQNVVYQSFISDTGFPLNDMPVFANAGKAVPWLTTNLAVPGHLLLLNTKSWGYVEDKPFTFEPGSSGGMLTNIPNTDAYYMWAKAYQNMMCHMPRANALITNIQTNQSVLQA